MGSAWEIEQDPIDYQYDLLRDGRVIEFALADEQSVADMMRQMGADLYDVVEFPNGTVTTVEDYLFKHG